MKHIGLTLMVMAGAFAGEASSRGTVTGVVLDGQGKPIEGARIWVKPSLTTGLVQARTGSDGRYRAEGLLHIPYNTFAWTKLMYREKTVCLRVAPVALSQYDSFVPSTGVSRDFKLRISGPIDDRGDIYYGGKLRVFTQLPKGTAVEVTFEPLGHLADGSIGKTLVRAVKDQMIEDIPVGGYRVSAQIVESGSPRRTARVSRKNFDANPGSEVVVEWESKDSCVGSFGNGLDRSYLWIQ